MADININFTIIDKFVKENNLTIKQFCRLCDIKYYNYRQLKIGDLNLKIDKLYKVAKTIQISANGLLGIKT